MAGHGGYRAVGSLRRYARATGGLASAAAVLVMFGWIAGVESLFSLRPHWPPMAPTTASMALLGGATLLAACAHPDGRRARRIARYLTTVNGTVALSLLVDAALGGPAGALLPARTSLHTSAAFLALNVSFLLLASGSTLARKVGEACAFASLSAAALALASYLYGVPVLYSLPRELPHVGMAPHTAFILLLLATGWLAANPHCYAVSALMTGDGGRLARRMLLLIALYPAVVLVVVLGARRGVYDWPVARALFVLAALAGSLALVVTTARRVNDLSRRHAATAAERDRAAVRLRQLVEGAADGIFLADLDGKYLDVNEAGCKMLGCTRDEIVGKTIADFIPAEDLERLWESRRQALLGVPQIGEWTIRHKDGRMFPIEVSATVLPGDRWQGIVRDISERVAVRTELKRAHDAETTARRRAEQVLDASGEITEALASIPATGIRAALEVVARHAQLLTGASYVALGIGDDPSRPFDPFVVVGMDPATAAAIGRNPRPIATLALAARGGETVRTADIRSHPALRGLPAGHPEIRGLLAIPIPFRGRVAGSIYVANKQGGEFSAADERTLAMLAQRAGAAIEVARLYETEAQGRAWLQVVFDEMPEGVLVANACGELILRNRAADALGFKASCIVLEDVVERACVLLSPSGAPLPRDQHPLFRVLRGGEERVDSVELAAALCDGSRVPVRVSAKRIPLPPEAPGALLVVQDIRALKEIERLREEWAAIVAHDLRQPISTVALGASLLMDRCKDLGHTSDAPALVERIQRAAWRLGRMTEDLLDISRIEARQLQVERAPIDMAEIVERQLDALRPASGGRALHLAVQGPPIVLGDAGRMEQVLSNLLGNALKYGDPRAPIDVTVTSRGHEVEVTVTNRGPSISPEEQASLFDRFTRSRKARKEGTPGLGLGLYIAKGLVEAHGGRMWVESRGGRTSFSFTVPAVAAPNALAVREQPARSGNGAPGARPR
jgi:PAS domain S-box-containing protein